MKKTLLPRLMQAIEPLSDANKDAKKNVELRKRGSWPASQYQMSAEHLHALVAACGSGRPLLVRGEPGVGKSDLARAAAELMACHFISAVVQPQTSYQDLLWEFDHTARLAQAQLLGREGGGSIEDVRNPENYIVPGPLWWAYDYCGEDKPNTACGYHPEDPLKGNPPSNGVVLLIDEIDKADISLCSGLLEVLGNGGFSVPSRKEPVQTPEGKAAPLVMITSNDTRELPAAFLRRCVVLKLELPSGQALIDHLVSIGKTHHPSLEQCVLAQAADQIARDRKHPDGPRAGQAEYLDLLRALVDCSDDTQEQLAWLDRLQQYFMKSGR